MNTTLASKCPVCGGALIAETSPFYLQAMCESCRVCMEWPRSMAHDVEELDGLIAHLTATKAKRTEVLDARQEA